MADFPKVTPYVIEEIISSDSFYTNYRAIATHLEGDYSYVVTEFNPSFMVQRTEAGALEPTDRFFMEFETALERFTNMSDSLRSLNEPFIAPIEEVLKDNNTVYVVRRLDKRYRSLDEGLGTERRDFSRAYVILRPLIQCLVAAYKRGLIFQFLPNSVGVNPYGQLILDSMFSWEMNHRNTYTELTKLFYRLIAGVNYNPGIPENPTIDGLGLPPRLTAFIKDVLMSEPAYGSVDDFAKQLRSVMDVEGNRDVITERSAAAFAQRAQPQTVKKGAAAGLIAAISIGLLLLIGGPVLWFYWPVISGSAVADPYELLVVEDEEPDDVFVAPATFVRQHTAYAITDPNDPTVMLNGSFYERGGTVFMAAYDNGFGLARRDGAASPNMLVSGVRPAFIVSHGDFIYFADGLSQYNIRRVRPDGSGLETVVNDSASFLTVSGDFLFYTNHSDRDFIYRLNLNTMHSTSFLQLSAYEMLVQGGQLYFVNGSGGFRIYSVPVDEADAWATRVNQSNSDNLRSVGGHIFYRNVEDNTIRRMTAQGEDVAFSTVPAQAASFDISGQLMAIVEWGTNMLWFYDLANESAVSGGSLVSYALMTAIGAHVIDHNDSRRTQWVPFVNLANVVAETPEPDPLTEDESEEEIEEESEIDEE